MTESDRILEMFDNAGWRCPKNGDWAAKGDNIPDEYQGVQPIAFAWDGEACPPFTTSQDPPFKPVPCHTCATPSKPFCRFEFQLKPDEDWGEGDYKHYWRGWKSGISLFAYECVEHGLFVHSAIDRSERTTGSLRNGRVVVT